MEYGVYGDLILRYPKSYSISLRGTIGLKEGLRGLGVKIFSKDFPQPST